jgi:hypothetical protein
LGIPDEVFRGIAGKIQPKERTVYNNFERLF